MPPEGNRTRMISLQQLHTTDSCHSASLDSSYVSDQLSDMTVYSSIPAPDSHYLTPLGRLTANIFTHMTHRAGTGCRATSRHRPIQNEQRPSIFAFATATQTSKDIRTSNQQTSNTSSDIESYPPGCRRIDNPNQRFGRWLVLGHGQVKCIKWYRFIMPFNVQYCCWVRYERHIVLCKM